MSGDFKSAAWLQWPQTRQLIAAFAPHPNAFRFVGGAVRDTLLSREVTDVDAATTLLPDAVMALLQQTGIRAIPTGIDHGTITAVIDGKHFEITTLRKDVATDGRHAEVAFTDDWKEDAARRDFTMNALYLSPEGELFDYFGGVTDARAGHVRFIGDAAARIAEDYLRVLRFFRFHAHYGKGAPDAAALAACAAAVEHLKGLSGERVQSELFKLFAAPHASQVLLLMQEKDLLPPLLGFDLHGSARFARYEMIEEVMGILLDPCVKLAAFIDTAKSVYEGRMALVSRLRLSNRQEKILSLIWEYMSSVQPNMLEVQKKRLLRKLGAADFKATVIVRWAISDDAITMLSPYAEMIRLADSTKFPPFPVSGDDLIAVGFAPGKKLGEKLRVLEEAWEASDYRLTREQLLALE